MVQKMLRVLRANKRASDRTVSKHKDERNAERRDHPLMSQADPVCVYCIGLSG